MATELVPPRGHGLVRTAHNLRRIVASPQAWGNEVGTDFWAIFNTAGQLTAGNAHELSDYGWTTTTLAFAFTGGADFLSYSDVGTPQLLALADAGDLLDSPSIFGDYQHALMASCFLGYMPTKLKMEAYAAFGVAWNNETATGFGFIEDCGAPGTVADHMAYIFSDGTNFKLRPGAATSAAVPAVNTNMHLWRIEVSSSGIEWFVDGVSQNSGSLLALQADEWPASFGAAVLATTGANTVYLGWVHIWYE